MVDQMAKDMDIHEKLKQSALAMIGLGVGELLGSFINGAIIDKLNHTKALIICMVEAVIALAMIHAYIYNSKFSFTFGFLMSAAWGF
jgi:predicted MFS family arabinose efflux permease